MSTQIDPLTGLPMVFDNIIEQIPLDAQIFPYADLGATARPTAPPLFPDSIIPVSAFLSGQHPDTGSAQTVATNGDHDLRVHVTNATSGGSILWENAVDLTLNDSRESANGNNNMWTVSNADAATLFIASVAAAVTVDHASVLPTQGQCTLEFYYAFGGFHCWILMGSLSYGWPSAGMGETSWSGVWSPPSPIALHNAVAPNADVDFIFNTDGNLPLRVSSNFTLVRAHA